jgi:hypothetical protein
LTIDECKAVFDNMKKASLLSNPLYIGIAGNINERFNQHMGDYDRYLFEKSFNNDFISTDTSKFGYRIAQAGFKKYHLLFCYVELEINRKAIQQAEFLLNRLFKPIFGSN